MYIGTFMNMFPAHIDDEGTVSINIGLELPKAYTDLLFRHVIFFGFFCFLHINSKKCQLPHKQWNFIPYVKTQGRIDYAKTVDILDKYTQVKGWCHSLIENNHYFDVSKLPEPLKSSTVIQKPGDAVIVLGCIH